MSNTSDKKKSDCFIFLYWEQETLQGEPFSYTAKCKKLSTAIKRFLNKHGESAVKVDYEVQHGKEFIDIAEEKAMEKFF